MDDLIQAVELFKETAAEDEANETQMTGAYGVPGGPILNNSIAVAPTPTNSKPIKNQD